MEYGLSRRWFLPESELYKKHPDWVIRSKRYRPIRSRNQLVLDLANPEVREYLIEALSKNFEEWKYYLCKMGYEPAFDRSWKCFSESRKSGRIITSICFGIVFDFGISHRDVSRCAF